jgi:hypothetical protein
MRRQTMLEYYFFLNAPGRVSLAPFTISVPAAPDLPEAPESPRIRFRSPAIQFLVRASGETGAGGSSSARDPRLSWRDVPGRLSPGEEAEIVLVRQDRDTRPLPSPRLLVPRTPVGAILEASPPREGDEAAGVLLRLRIVPLEEGRLNIPAFSVPAGDYSLDIPALSVPVGPAGRDREAAPLPSRGEISAPPERSSLPFPETALRPLFPFKAGCESIRDRARAFWDRGLRVEALAELRRNERDYAGGPALSFLRRDAEKILGLSGNGGEAWRPRVLFRGIFAISAGLAAASLVLGFLSAKKRVTPAPAWCYKVIGKFKKPAWVLRVLAALFAVLAFFSLGALGFLPLEGSPFAGLSGFSRPALAREAEAFRVPGPEGTPAFRFEEGRRVLVRSVREGWAYAEIPGKEGRSGWVRTEALVFY